MKPSPKNQVIVPTNLRGWALAALCTGLAGSGWAQPVVPPGAIEQFSHTMGNRVEAAVILGGDYGAASGAYRFRSNQSTDLKITKLGGGGMVRSPHPLGETGLQWAPVLLGNIGYVSVSNDFAGGYLQGNKSATDMLALEAGAGARFFFNEHWSLAPALSGIYGRTINEFTALNPVGVAVKAAAAGTFVDWTLESWTTVPSLDLRYAWSWRGNEFQFSSRYTYFHTSSLGNSSPLVVAGGDSQTWMNKVEVDVPLDWKMFGQQVRTGGYFSRTELAGNASDGFNEDHLYTVNGRLVLDVAKKYRFVRWVGLNASYFFADNFSGWSAGFTLQLQY
jgi:hypothetical protein